MNPWKSSPVIYEINTRVWLEELSLAAGNRLTLATIPGEIWDQLAHLKIDAVWMMGVWERSAAGIAISNLHAGNLADFRRALPDFTFADNVGSPYCVKRYVVDAFLGGAEGLAAARQQLAKRNIKLILDFVPNHLAHDHPWVKESPDFFIQGNKEDLRDDPITYVQIGGNIFACGKDPYYPAWQDVLQVNAFDPGFCAATIETVTAIAAQCDGVRCDMAMLMVNSVVARTWGKRAGAPPLPEFWEALIPAVKKSNPGFIFLAEAYWDMEWTLQQQGFDFCYDKRLYDRFEHGDAEGIRLHLSAGADYQNKLVRFIENHDEPRAAAVFSLEKERALAATIATLPGARLFHEGQFEGRKVRLPVFLRRRPDEPADPCLAGFYEKLLQEIADPLFHEGEWRLLQAAGWPDNTSYTNLVAWCRADETERFLMVVNLSGTQSQGRVTLPWDELRGKTWRLADPLSGEAFDRHGDELVTSGLYVNLPPWGFHFLRFKTF